MNVLQSLRVVEQHDDADDGVDRHGYQKKKMGQVELHGYMSMDSMIIELFPRPNPWELINAVRIFACRGSRGT